MRVIAPRRLAVVHCLIFAMLAAVPAWSGASEYAEMGRRIAFDSARGNCLACHQIQGGESPGDLGPALVAIQTRFPDRGKLRGQLWDPMEHNPDSRMPPFGRHRILTEEELDMVVAYLYTL
jgi:sulfur-oxidizing protein SoxX